MGDPEYFPRHDYTFYDTLSHLAKAQHQIWRGDEARVQQVRRSLFPVWSMDFCDGCPFRHKQPRDLARAAAIRVSRHFPVCIERSVAIFPGQHSGNQATALQLWVALRRRYEFASNSFYYSLLKDPASAAINNFVSSNRGNEYHNIQPRLGLAYDVSGNGKFLVRAGFGRYVTRNRPWLQEESEQSTIGAAVFITDPKQLQFYPDITAALGGLTVQQYVAAGGPRSIGIIDNNFKVPYSNNFTGGFSWQINPRTVLDVDGVLDKSHDEWAAKDLNLPNGVLSATNPRPVPQFTNVTDLVNFGWASFHALETQLRTRTKGFDTINVSYTYSQSLINAATLFAIYLFPTTMLITQPTPRTISVSASLRPCCRRSESG